MFKKPAYIISTVAYGGTYSITDTHGKILANRRTLAQAMQWCSANGYRVVHSI